MALFDHITPAESSLNTDLYELTMAQGYWDSSLREARGCFTVFFRDCPFEGGYALCAGTGQIADLIEHFTFSEATISWLSELTGLQGDPLFKPEFLEFLKNHRLDLDIYAVPEGEVVFGREPLVRVQGSLIDCQLVETALLNLVNFQTLVATKTTRVVRAAMGRPVFDFGLRRAQGPDGGLAVARASYLAGASATSNVLAGKLYNIPVFGTHAHSWVMSFESELEAFRQFAKTSPANCSFLLDTYSFDSGLEHALCVAREMHERGERLHSVRIDSGDLARLSKQARHAFDEAGLSYVKISVSNDLDEYTIQSLLAQGAPIDSFGVGTKLATCDSQPSLGGVYKLCAIQREPNGVFEPVMKISEQAYKRTIPGIQQVVRYHTADGKACGDMIVQERSTYAHDARMIHIADPDIYYRLQGEPRALLQPHVLHGERVAPTETLLDVRARTQASLASLDPTVMRFLNPQVYPVGLDPELAHLRQELVRAGMYHTVDTV